MSACAAVTAPAADAAWPLHPRQGPHPVRAGVLDPVGHASCFAEGVALPVEERHCHAHGGVDVVVDERRCAPRAPRGMCRRVYAIESGRVWKKRNRDRPGMCSGGMPA